MRVRDGAVLSAGFVVILACSSARAAFDEFAIGVKAGTLGLGGEITTDLIPQVNLLRGVQWLDFGFDAQLGDIDYRLDLNFLNPLVLVDWYPFDGSFRISGGVLFNGSDIQLVGSVGTIHRNRRHYLQRGRDRHVTRRCGVSPGGSLHWNRMGQSVGQSRPLGARYRRGRGVHGLAGH